MVLFWLLHSTGYTLKSRSKHSSMAIMDFFFVFIAIFQPILGFLMFFGLEDSLKIDAKSSTACAATLGSEPFSSTFKIIYSITGSLRFNLSAALRVSFPAAVRQNANMKSVLNVPSNCSCDACFPNLLREGILGPFV